MILLLYVGAYAESVADHVLAPGDQLEIYIDSLPKLEKIYTVRADGKFFIPTLGEVPAAGLTVRQVQGELQKLFGKELRNPKFSLGLFLIAPKKVTILGEVANPGAYEIRTGSTLFELLALAGGPKPLADIETAYLTRARTGQQELIDLTGASVESLGVQNGDVLLIRQGVRVNVTGEVNQPGPFAVSYSHGDPFDAISKAGGAKPNAALGRVLVFRPTVKDAMQLDLSPPRKDLPEPAKQLQEGDVVIVPPRQVIVLQKEPKPIPLQGGETVLDVLIKAGVGTNLDDVTLVRQENAASLAHATPDTLREADLKPERIDLSRYFEHHDASVLVPVYDGDIVLVPADEPFNLLTTLSFALAPLQYFLTFRNLFGP